ncbi:MAG: TIGR04283 family arsenosugar biosynthesis glycosyltransferase [Proteobacteria bacterium]|nr:TIGR04283 family arsenosugar biosynthesis glycosyltransferase [Pseudomonadota bacterium]MBU1568943.1 TIGR04283 family arsenosugar biosynthesis glycosyltransferase [Pseudomonadota bacterium]
MDSFPAVSVIIPVLNEAHGINVCLEALFAQFSGEPFETIVVDGDAEGTTLRQIVHPKVIKFCAPPGRGKQMNAGAEVARGEILIFLHADTRLPSNALSRIREVMADRQYSAGAFTLHFDSKRPVFGLIAMAASWRYRLTRLPYGDQAFFMHREYFNEIGGFAEIPIMEDVEMMRRIRKRGGRVRILHDSVTTSPRRWEKNGILFSVIRTWALAFLFACGADPERLAKHYGPHTK